jgi:hypothetical protein
MLRQSIVEVIASCRCDITDTCELRSGVVTCRSHSGAECISACDTLSAPRSTAFVIDGLRHTASACRPARAPLVSLKEEPSVTFRSRGPSDRRASVAVSAERAGPHERGASCLCTVIVGASVARAARRRGRHRRICASPVSEYLFNRAATTADVRDPVGDDQTSWRQTGDSALNHRKHACTVTKTPGQRADTL